MDRQASLSNRLESPITSNLDNLQAKKNFSVSHLLDLEEAGEMVGSQADESVGEAGRSMLESPGLTSGSDTTQQESKLKKAGQTEKNNFLNLVIKILKPICGAFTRSCETRAFSCAMFGKNTANFTCSSLMSS